MSNDENQRGDEVFPEMSEFLDWCKTL